MRFSGRYFLATMFLVASCASALYFTVLNASVDVQRYPDATSKPTAATPEQTRAAETQLAAEKAAADRRERLLASREAKAEREKSRTAHRDLSGKEAVTVAAEEHNDVLKTPAWSPPKLQPGDRHVAYTSTTTQRIDVEGQKADAIADSPDAPIATERDGELVSFDTSLRRVGNGWQPTITDLITTFPEDLTAGIIAPLGGDFGDLKIRPARGSEKGRAVGKDKKIFYPNALEDTDVIAESAPRGGEISWMLRSNRSPESLPLEIDIEGKDESIELVSGGAVVNVDGRAVVSIRPPIAFDAQGQSVPVKYTVAGNGLTVRADHEEGDFAYPIVVDPYYVLNGVPAFREVNADNATPVSCSAVPWGGSDNSIRVTYWTQSISSGCRHYSEWSNATHGGPWHAKWIYNSPNASTVFRSEWGGVTMQNNAGNRSDIIIGIANAPLSAWEGNYWLQTNPSNATATVCANASCTLAGSADNRVQFVHRIIVPAGQSLGAGVAPRASHVGTISYFSDYDNPTLSGVPAVNELWQNIANPALTASDAGVGLSQGFPGAHAGLPAISIKRDGADYFSSGPTCGGGVSNPCPTSHPATPALNEGDHTWTFSSSDIVGRTTTAVRRLRIDRTPPEIGISGRLGAIALDAAAIGTAQPRTMVNNTPFTIQAVDGRRYEQDGVTPAPAKDRRSGVQQVTARVFGSNTDGSINLGNEIAGVIDNAGIKTNAATECDTNAHPTTAVDSCKITYTGTLNASTLPRGIYYFRVTAKDWLNQESTKDFKVGVGSASLETVIEGQATSRYVPIQIKRERGSAASASLQFRTALNADWCAIATSSIRLETNPTATAPAQLNFDSNGLTETVVVDLDDLRKPSGNCSYSSTRLDDGTVYIRGLVAGSESQSIRASEDVAIKYERGGLGTDNDSANLGVGSVDLVSGNLSFSATDVSVDAYKSDLTVSRTFNSRYAAQKNGPFGRGWEIGLSSESMGTSYEKVSDYSDVDIPELERYPAVVVESSDGSTMTFELEETTGKYKAEDGLETLKLERIPDAYDPTRSAGFKLTDLESGTVATFSSRSAETPAGDFKLTDVYEPATSDKVTYAFGQSSTIGNYPTYAFAPSGGLSCRDTNEGAQQSYDTLPRGCQALKFNYDLNGERRLTSISLKTYDPAVSGMVETTVAQYAYNANRQLAEVWDPRESTLTPTPTHLKTAYTYLSATDHRVGTVTPPGELPFTIAYLKLPEDSTYGRVNYVSRSALSAGTATWTVRFFVPTMGTNAPFDFSVAETSKWGQERPPFMAAAVFPPDQPPNGTPATNYDRASMSYLDPLGREVNSREPGNRISTKEFDKWGSVTRTLTPENRARAMALPTPAERLSASEKWDTQNTYGDVPGSGEGRRHLVESVGPERSVRLDDGSEANARTHTRYTYDEGISQNSDTGEPFDLVTTERVSALVGTTDHDVRTTETNYGSNQADWRLRIPREVTTDPGTGNLNIKRKVDVNADGMETARYQPRSQNSSEPSTTKTIYWTASTNPDDAECSDRPEWLGLPCKVLPGAQPTTAGLAKLPVKKITYNALRKPLTTTDNVVDAAGVTKTRTSTATYDAAGRVLTESIAGGIGEPVRTTKHIYSQTSGREIQTQSLNSNDTVYKTISRTFDTLGRQTAYTDAEGHTSTKTYDLLSRVASTNDGKAIRTNTYDAITGDLIAVNDAGVGDFTATYDADGRVVTTTLPGGMIKTFHYTESGFQDYVSYAKTTGCTSSCQVFENWAKESAHGQIRELWQDILPQGQSLKETAYEYRYDKAGRLKAVGDWRNDSGTWKCGVREYTLDADSNRTAKKAIAEQDYYCDFGASGTTTSSTYDNADRITDAGYVYDAFGRITTTPQAAAGGTGDFNATYYTNDLARSVTQNGTTQTLGIDPKLRMTYKSKVTGGNTTEEWYAYTDDSDSPAWIQTGSTWQRFLDGIDGAAGVQKSSGGAEYYFVNLRGDVVANGFPDPVEISDVDEFGVPKTDLPVSRRYGFHGSKQREALTSQGMIAMGVRLYAPHTGRFLQVDPVLGGTANPYEYPSDPVNQMDLDGRRLTVCRVWWCPQKMKYTPKKAVKVVVYVVDTFCIARGWRALIRNGHKVVTAVCLAWATRRYARTYYR